MLSHGPDLREELRLTEQIHCHLDTIDRQAEIIAVLRVELREALAIRQPDGIRCVHE